MRWIVFSSCAAGVVATTASGAAHGGVAVQEQPDWGAPSAVLGLSHWQQTLDPSFEEADFARSREGGPRGGAKVGLIQVGQEGHRVGVVKQTPTNNAPALNTHSSVLVPLEAAALVSAMVGANLQRALDRKIDAIQNKKQREMRLARLQALFSTFFIIHTLLMSYVSFSDVTQHGITALFSFSSLLNILCLSVLPDYFIDGKYLKYIRTAFSKPSAELSEEEIAELAAEIRAQVLRLANESRGRGTGLEATWKKNAFPSKNPSLPPESLDAVGPSRLPHDAFASFPTGNNTTSARVDPFGATNPDMM